MVDGMWVDSPNKVKKEFLDHFSNRFCKPGERKATLQMEFPKQIHYDQQRELESERVVDAGMFHGIKLDGSVNLSHMFYADDAVFIGQWSENNISTLVHVLECFHRVSGLKINMSKSKILGVHVDNVKVSRAANKLSCLVLKTPFLYLGSCVGGAMHRLQAWNDIVDRVRRRLSKWKMKMLLIGGRLTLVKSVLASIPIFHMSMFKAPSVPSGILRTFESIRCHFFNGHDVSSKKASWVQWNKVWRFLTQDTSLWAKVIKATLFWEDVWCEGGKLKDRFPRAYALESCKTITVGSKLVQPNFTYSFRKTPRGVAE
nr:RNA-directed DNA polymerase, eukaryota [Tanacetum cinerariifolium]